jgi:hypothetical protein
MDKSTKTGLKKVVLREARVRRADLISGDLQKEGCREEWRTRPFATTLRTNFAEPRLAEVQSPLLALESCTKNVRFRNSRAPLWTTPPGRPRACSKIRPEIKVPKPRRADGLWNGGNEGGKRAH